MIPIIKYKARLNKLLIALFLLALLGSCGTKRLSGDKQYSASFQSYPNGLADINLELNENLRFVYTMEIYPEPGNESGDTLPELFTFRGRWGNDTEDYYIRFHRRNKPDLHALVSPGYEPTTNVEVADERTIRFPLKDQEIVIWGIRCFKEEGE